MPSDQSAGDSMASGLLNTTNVSDPSEMVKCNQSANITENCTMEKVFVQGISHGPIAILVPILFGIIFIVGVIGNGTVIFTVARNKVMRNVPNILIVSLSLGDLLLILVSVPFSATIYTLKSWPYGETICKFNFYMQTMSLGVSVFTLIALSADRYMAIVDPMSKITGKTIGKAMTVVGVIWASSFLLAIPDWIFSNTSDFRMEDGNFGYMCTPYPLALYPAYPKTQGLIRFVVFFAIPVVTIGFFYLMMAYILIQSGQSMPCEGSKSAMNQQRQIAARKKVAKVVLSFVFIFLICWLPRHIYILWFFYDEYGEYNDFWYGFQIFGFCLTFVNSCVNPLALYFLSSQFRKFYNKYLFCCIPTVRVYNPLEPTSTMHNFNSTVRRASSTTNTMVHSMSQSMC